MESHFQLIPHELIELIFQYLFTTIIGVTSISIDNLQEYLEDIDINLNWEIIFSNKFNIEYRRIKKLLAYDKSLNRIINWYQHYLDFIILLERNPSLNFKESIDNDVSDNDILYIDYSTLDILYSSLIFDKYPNSYYMRKYFNTVGIRSKISSYILGKTMLNWNYSNDIRDFFNQGYLTKEFKYNDNKIGGTSIIDDLGIIYLLSFDPLFTITIEDLQEYSDRFDYCYGNLNGEEENPFLQYYQGIKDMLLDKYDKPSIEDNRVHLPIVNDDQPLVISNDILSLFTPLVLPKINI